MRSAVSLVLVASLVATELPAAAGQSDDAGWTGVRKLAPGKAVILTIKDAPAITRQLVAADDSTLTVLNADTPALTADAANVLRRAASIHPNYLDGARNGGRFVLEKDVRVEPDGVFVADRKLADLAQVVERYERSDVREIATPMTESNPVACAVAGYFGGGIIGGFPGIYIGAAVGRDTGPALVGMFIGWFVGAAYVYGKCRHHPEKVIYSAP